MIEQQRDVPASSTDEIEQTTLSTSAPKASSQTLFAELGLILLGGVIGTLTRIVISVFLGKLIDHGFPFDIVIINCTGAFLIGLLAGWRDADSRLHELIWLTLAVGFLGAYTTFSSYALGIVQLANTGKTLLSLIYLGGSVAFGLLAVEIGLKAGSRLRQ